MISFYDIKLNNNIYCQALFTVTLKTHCQFLMGGIQRAGTGKNKKVTEIFPLLAFWPEGLGIKFL